MRLKPRRGVTSTYRWVMIGAPAFWTAGTSEAIRRFGFGTARTVPSHDASPEVSRESGDSAALRRRTPEPGGPMNGKRTPDGGARTAMSANSYAHRRADKAARAPGGGSLPKDQSHFAPDCEQALIGIARTIFLFPRLPLATVPRVPKRQIH